MKKRLTITPIILSLVAILGGSILSACSQVSAARPIVDMQSEINTAVAATLVQYMIETKVAAEATNLFSEPVALLQATDTPLPTATLAPTETTPPPTPTVPAPAATQQPAVAAFPEILAEANTNCRVGPSTRYYASGYLAEGMISRVHGRDTNKDWWYIEHPSDAGEFCWVWDGSTIVKGDTSGLPVVAAPPLSTLKTSNIFTYNCYPYATCNQYTKNYPCYCGTFVNGIKLPPCKPKKDWCYPTNYPIDWNPCNPYITNYNPCNYPIFWGNTCKKNSCPPVTIVNYKNYCKKYPNCCE
jgi:hypothetical protein